MFENSYEREIKDLYTKFKGDISIFQKDPYSKQSLDIIMEEFFHLSFTYPFKIGTIRGKKTSSKSKEIYQLAKDLTHKSKGIILLDKLFTEVMKFFELNNEEIASLIYELVEYEVLIPI